MAQKKGKPVSSRVAISLGFAVTLLAALAMWAFRPHEPSELERFVAREDRLERAQLIWEAEHPEFAAAASYARQYSEALTVDQSRPVSLDSVWLAIDASSVLLLGDHLFDPNCRQEHLWFLQQLRARNDRPMALMLEFGFDEHAEDLAQVASGALSPAGFVELQSERVVPPPPLGPGYVAFLDWVVQSGSELLPGDSLATWVALAEREPLAMQRRDLGAVARICAWLEAHPDGLLVGIFQNTRLAGPGHLLDQLQAPAIGVLRTDDRLLRRLGVARQDPDLLAPFVLKEGLYFLPLRRPRDTLLWEELQRSERRLGSLLQLIDEASQGEPQ